MRKNFFRAIMSLLLFLILISATCVSESLEGYWTLESIGARKDGEY